jgi:hypothetical protein
MLERPGAEDLLTTARSLLLEELLPLLPEAQRFQLRMVANAMGIAARAEAQGDAWRETLRARLRAMLSMPQSDDAALLRALASEIRAGQRDPGDAETAAILRELTRARCAVSAPRALER